MKTSKISLGLFILITLFAINSLVTDVSAQKIPKGTPRCTASASQIYFVDSGQSVTEVHPGSNGGNGYQLNILGSNVDKFEVIKPRYMTALNIIPGYTNATSAKWGLEFAANMGRMITSIKMKNNCSGETSEFRLTTKVKLLDQ